MALPRSTRLTARAICAALGLACAAVPAAGQSPDVGSTIANPAVLGRMFANVCVAAQDAAGVEAALRGVGMLDNPETGTFFHQLFDLSVNPTGGGCSMVFVTDQPDADAIAAFTASVTSAHGGEVPTLVVSSRESGGEIYVRARIEVSW